VDFGWDDQKGELRVGDMVIPLDDQQMLRINYVGPPGSFKMISLCDILNYDRDNVALPELRDAIVLIGVTGIGQQDYHATPYSNRYGNFLPSHNPGLMSGTEIHANIIATLHDRAFIYASPWLGGLPTLLVLGAILGFVLTRLSLVKGMLVAIVFHFGTKLAALLAFSWFDWRLEVTALLLLGLTTYGATFILRWHILRRMLGVVKSETIAVLLERDPARLNPGGENRVVTVAFTDIRNFTCIASINLPRWRQLTLPIRPDDN
jgi:adenylate cyclase